MSFLRGFRGLDIYRDTPKDLTEQTVTGAAVSVVCTIAIVWLFCSEVQNYMTTEFTSEMAVESMDAIGFLNENIAKEANAVSDEQEFVKINVDIDYWKMPCVILSVDTQDVMGNRQQDVQGKLHKTRLDSYGTIKMDSNGNQLPDVEDEIDELIPDVATMKNEGCKVSGFLRVRKVPGNFHVSAKLPVVLKEFFDSANNLNVSHTVNDFWFGEANWLDYVEDAEHVNTLGGSTKSTSGMTTENAISVEYYVKIVPTAIMNQEKEQIFKGYQYVSSSNIVKDRYSTPTCYFRYEFSPILVKFGMKKKTLSHFLVQISAIIGGVFTVLGMLNSFIHTSLKSMIRDKR